jgi:hypothetical protein
MIYTHVARKGAAGVASPLDFLAELTPEASEVGWGIRGDLARGAAAVHVVRKRCLAMCHIMPPQRGRMLANHALRRQKVVRDLVLGRQEGFASGWQSPVGQGWCVCHTIGGVARCPGHRKQSVEPEGCGGHAAAAAAQYSCCTARLPDLPLTPHSMLR